MTEQNPHIGSTFESWLDEAGRREEVRALAMKPSAALPPIGGFILTGQLSSRQAAHAPVILRHDLTTDFFGIEERAASWPEFRSLQVFPISEAALLLLRALLDDDPRFEIDTGHSGFGWIARPKVPAKQLAGLPVRQPPLFVTSDEQASFRASQPADHFSPILPSRSSWRCLRNTDFDVSLNNPGV